MPENSISPARFFYMILAGVISLAVGVGGGLILNRLTEKQSKLVYGVTASEIFTGQTQNIAILAIDINNAGKAEIEELLCEISFENATISEYKVLGLPNTSQTITSSTGNFQLRSPFLNPQEKISIQLLLVLNSDEFSPPIINVRGKGINYTVN